MFGAMVSATEGEKDRGTVSEHVVNGDANYLEDFVTVLGSTPTKPAADLDPKTAARIAKGTELSDGFISVFKNDWGIPSPQFQFDQLKLDLGAAGDDLINFFVDKGKDGLKAWEALFDDDALRVIPDNLTKVDNHVNDFGKSFDDIATEFNSIPTTQRQGWINHLEFRSNGNRVNKSLDRPELHSSWTDADVPPHYKSHTNSAGQDFNSLANDPVDGIVPSTRQEAMAGIESVNQGMVPGPLTRGPVKIEFYDGNGSPWDVKTPNGNFPAQIPEGFGNSIKSQLRNKPVESPGQFPNSNTGDLEDIKIIFDNSYISTSQRQEIWNWLNANLTPAELDKIVEVNIRL